MDIVIITTVAQIVQCLLAQNAQRRPRHSSIALLMTLWSIPCKRAANAVITFYDF